MSSTPRLLVIAIQADPPARLDKALARDVPAGESLSRSRLARLIAEGAVRRGAEVLTDPRAKVAEGEEISIAIGAAEEIDAKPEAIPLEIIHEDAELIVVNKPVGMVVHPAPGTPSGTLVNALMHHCADTLSGIGGALRPGIVHRIDKDTSGLLVAAKSDRAHHGLAEQFAAHTVEREYRAVVHGAPDAGDPRLRGLRGVAMEPGGVIRIATEIGRHRTDRQRQAVMWANGRRAVTRARVDEAFGAAALVTCWLETGRTHQIRVHLSYAGHALLGDETYGGRRKLPRAMEATARTLAEGFPRQALHAATLGFAHPVSGEHLRFDAPLPRDMEDLLAALRGAAPSA
ncbi:RluA family pseudouridine synthase [Mangrovicoccus algicola]|uniref:Pseudouridine synthase n=1 Tax=Mangrovicoccus algicola TaxID=2771008 RepID=A0A8J6YV66_9RHOB|nr:RluA family pseudouridine synthase [Mangrovicoccus algicola]MBE3639843.1 RluA family pseudouridine synthase [Mangrovicoccus algicola]